MTVTGKICFVIPSLSAGGAERVVSVLSSRLAADGYEVAVVKYFDTEADYPVDSRVEVVCLSGGSEAAYRGLSLPAKLKLLRAALRRLDPAYVVPFLPHVAVHTALAGFGLGMRSIQTIRVAPAVAPASRIQRFLRDVLVALSWRTFAQTESQRAYFPRWVQNKVTVLPNPVADDMFAVQPVYPEAVTELMAAGRLTGQKNFSMLLRAVKAAQNAGCPMRLSIYGEGPLRPALEEEIRELGVTDSCFLQGRTRDMAGALARSHCFILSSDFEGMPNALMEAMAAGLPCIATDCPTGPAELIGPERGILVPMQDEAAMTAAILQLASDPAQAAQMGKNAKKYMRAEYSAEIIAARFVQQVLLRRE